MIPILQGMYYFSGFVCYAVIAVVVGKVLLEAMNAGEYGAQIRADDEGW